MTAFDVKYASRLHLIVVRRAQRGFQHVHPVMDATGAWRTVGALSPGSWWVLADVVPDGWSGLTLGTDLAVPGDTTAAAPTQPVRAAQVEDFTVTVTGELRGGQDSPLGLEVLRDGRPLTDLEPYLGAHGHLSALREAASPTSTSTRTAHEGTDGPHPDRSWSSPPRSHPGRIHLCLDVKHAGLVPTALLVLGAKATRAASPPAAPTEGHDHSQSGPQGTKVRPPRETSSPDCVSTTISSCAVGPDASSACGPSTSSSVRIHAVPLASARCT